MQTIKTTQLKEGMITALPVMTKRGLIIVGGGITLSDSLIARISFYGIDHIEIEEYHEPDAIAALQQTEPTYSQRVKNSLEFQDFQIAYTKATGELKEELTKIAQGTETIDTDALRQIVQPLLEKTSTSIEMFDLLHNMRTVDDSIYAHSLNVTLIAYMLGRWLKMLHADLDQLILSGLLHDIGKTRIPAEILDKPEKYTDEEFLLVRKHPVFGYEILLPYAQLDPRIKNAALMHHERRDGSGYPQKRKGNEIDEFGQIISIADVYDAMTAARSYRAPLCPFQVIADFEIEGLQIYNPKFILTFLERIAFIYQNNRVQLTDGRSANIIMLNRQFLSRPIVEVNDGSCIDLSRTPDLRIKALL